GTKPSCTRCARCSTEPRRTLYLRTLANIFVSPRPENVSTRRTHHAAIPTKPRGSTARLIGVAGWFPFWASSSRKLRKARDPPTCLLQSRLAAIWPTLLRPLLVVTSRRFDVPWTLPDFRVSYTIVVPHR